MTPQLQLDITILEQRDSKGEVTAPGSAYSSQLTWTAHTVAYDDSDGRRVVLDFEQRQQREIDERARTVTVKPLLATVSHRASEVRNRGEHIYSVLKAGGLPDNDFAPLLAEHQLSVSSPASPRTVGKRSVFARLTGGPDIEVVERRSQTDLTVGARCLMSISHEDHAQALAQPDAVASFTQFLRHAFGGHPMLLRRIREAKRLPASVTLGHLTPMHVGGEVIVRVVPPTALPREPSSEGFDQRLPLDDSQPIDAVLRAHRTTPPSTAARASEALALLQGPTPLPGLLTFLELTLEQPVAMPPDIAAAVRSSTDDAIPSFLELLRPPSAADAPARLRAYEDLRGPAGPMAYLLGVFEAVIHRVLGQRASAIELLTNVLEVNPRLTGAWKDLGDLFCPDYDYTRAWLCWERARAIAPTHPALDDVAAYERQLEADHPEYFRSA